jgi:hypothetical protein
VPSVPSSSRARARAPVGGEAPVEADLQHDAGGARGVDRPVQVRQLQPHRLLAEHALARLRGGHHEIGVEASRRGDDDGVDLGVVPHLRDIGVRPVGAQCTGQPLRRSGSRIGHRDQPRAGDAAAHRLPVERTHPARPDQGHSYRLARHHDSWV